MSATRLGCGIFVVMFLTLWYALSPSKETRVRVSDSTFRQQTQGDTRNQYRLTLSLEKGSTYDIYEKTTHAVTTRDFGTSEVLARTEYRSIVHMGLTVASTSDEEIVCQVEMYNFIGYEELKEEENEYSDPSRLNRNKEMFAKVQQYTRGVKFTIALGHDGTVQAMETYKLRKAIIDGLHESGSLPMHMEHAVRVGTQVFNANGASFGPQGRTRVSAPVYITKRDGCKRLDKAMKGKLVILPRGGCTFQKKAKHAAQVDAVGLIVVDEQVTSGAVTTYMGGEDNEVPIVTVIVNKDCFDTILNFVKGFSQFQTLDNGDIVGTESNVVEILGGANAMEAINSRDDNGDFQDGDDDDDDEKNHHLNPIKADGLHDFVGIGYVVDEIIRTRFSIFPPSPVTIGSKWERSLLVNDRIDPTTRAHVDEIYRLVAVKRLEADESMANRGDFVGEIDFRMEERPAPSRLSFEDEEESKPQGPFDDESVVTPQFSRPAFKGHSLSTQGTYNVHMPTGFVLSGEATSTASAERVVLIVNKRTGKQKAVKAKVDLVATTEYQDTDGV